MFIAMLDHPLSSSVRLASLRTGVMAGALTLGTLAAFLQYSQRFFRPIQILVGDANRLKKWAEAQS